MNFTPEQNAYFDGEEDAIAGKAFSNPYFDHPVYAAAYERGYDAGIESNEDFAHKMATKYDGNDFSE